MRGRTTTYRPRRTGERKRKSVRGCICGPDLSVIALKVLVKGPGEVAGLTDAERPRRLGPKRASHIRTTFALRKVDDVRKHIVRREIKKGDKTIYKAPRIQRLITEKRLRRKALNKRNRVDRWKATKEAHQAYEKLLSKYLKEKKATDKAARLQAIGAKAGAKPAPAAPAKPVAPAKAQAPVAKPVAPAKATPAPAKQAAPAKATPAPAKAAAPAKPAAPAKAAAPAKEAKKGGKK